MFATQNESELKQKHFRQLIEQQTILVILKTDFSNIKLGIKNKYNNMNSDSLKTINLECPPIYRQSNSHKHCINQKIDELKNKLKIDETNEPRDELNFLKSQVKLTTFTA